MVRKVIIDLRTKDSVKQSKKKFKKAAQFYSNRKALLEKIKKRVSFHYENMIKEIRKAPPKRNYPSEYPIKYTSAKQARLVGAKLNGKPHKRTNASGDAWYQKVKIKDNSRVSTEVGTESPVSRFIRGRPGLGTSVRSVKRYEGDIQNFNRVTGYVPAHIVMKKHHKRAVEDARDITEKHIKDGLDKLK